MEKIIIMLLNVLYYYVFIYSTFQLINACDVIVDCQDGEIMNIKILLGNKFYVISLSKKTIS